MRRPHQKLNLWNLGNYLKIPNLVDLNKQWLQSRSLNLILKRIVESRNYRPAKDSTPARTIDINIWVFSKSTRWSRWWGIRLKTMSWWNLNNMRKWLNKGWIHKRIIIIASSSMMLPFHQRFQGTQSWGGNRCRRINQWAQGCQERRRTSTTTIYWRA